MLFDLPIYKQSKTVLLIDQSSTRAGFALLDAGTVSVGSIVILGKNRYERVNYFREWLIEALEDVDECWLEGGTTQGRMRTEAQVRLANVIVWEIEKACFDKQIPLDTIHNQTLKKNIIRLSKIEMTNDQSKLPVRAAVEEILGIQAKLLDGDAIDAAAMGLLYAHSCHKTQKEEKKCKAQ